MKSSEIFATALVICASAIFQSSIQSQVLPPGADIPYRTSDELDQLLAPIALYPDPLIAQILPAATVPAEIVLADRYVRGGYDVNQIDFQPWSASVKAVAHYPDILKWMDDNLAWTTDMGQTFISQPDDVMNAIQRLRAKAQSIGALQTTPQQTVIYDAGLIEIVPANPEVIYVPVYQPEFVFGWRPYPRTGVFLSFGAGFAIGSWLNHDFDWHDRRVISWRRDQPRPRDWWYRPPEERRRPIINNNIVVFKGRDGEHSASVWRPRSQPPITDPHREDRGREFRTEPARPVISRAVTPREEPRREPVPEFRRPTETPRQAEPVRQAEPRRQPEPTRAPETRAAPESRPVPGPRPMPAPARQVYRSQSQPASRQPSGALIGVHSAQDTHTYSTRGQRSRESVSRPAPASRSSAPLDNPLPRRTPISEPRSNPIVVPPVIRPQPRP